MSTRVRSIPRNWLFTHRSRSQRPATTSAAAMSAPTTTAPTTRWRAALPAKLPARELIQHCPIALYRDFPVGFAFRVLAPATAHLLEVQPAVVRRADHRRKQFGSARRNDDTAADVLD